MGDPHRLDVQSPTLPALFEDIARQLFSRLINLSEVGATLREKIAVEGESSEQLLIAWVTSLIDLFQVQNMLLTHFQITEIETPGQGFCFLKAEVVGEL